jgi:hypothetical protein
MKRSEANALVQNFLWEVYDAGFYSGREMKNSFQYKAAVEEANKLKATIIDALTTEEESDTPS